MNLHWKRNLLFVFVAAVLLALCVEAVRAPGGPFAPDTDKPSYAQAL